MSWLQIKEEDEPTRGCPYVFRHSAINAVYECAHLGNNVVINVAGTLYTLVLDDKSREALDNLHDQLCKFMTNPDPEEPLYLEVSYVY